jgi:hypothetical protein
MPMDVMLLYVPHTNDKRTHLFGTILLCHCTEKHLHTMTAYFRAEETESTRSSRPRDQTQEREHWNSAAKCNTEDGE